MFQHVMIIVKYPFLSSISAVTFDDFNTLRYSKKKENIIYPIFRMLKNYGVKAEEKDFLSKYFEADEAYRKSLRVTFRESLLDDIITNVLVSLGYESSGLRQTVEQVVSEVLATRNAVWYSDAIPVLSNLRNKDYKLGLITNTHWRILKEDKREFEKYFDVVTVSYEHGYVKPHPSIFLVTLQKLGVSAQSCLHVGDDPIADIQGAKDVGMKTAFVKKGKNQANASIQMRKLSELAKFL